MLIRFYYFIQTVISKVQRLIRYLVIDRHELLFIRHNKRIWREYLVHDSQSEILLELDSVSSSIISFSCLANILAKKHKATITGYSARNKSFRARISNRITKKIYKSFNVEKFNYYKLNKDQLIEVENLFNKIKSSLNLLSYSFFIFSIVLIRLSTSRRPR